MPYEVMAINGLPTPPGQPHLLSVGFAWVDHDKGGSFYVLLLNTETDSFEIGEKFTDTEINLPSHRLTFSPILGEMADEPHGLNIFTLHLLDSGHGYMVVESPPHTGFARFLHVSLFKPFGPDNPHFPGPATG